MPSLNLDNIHFYTKSCIQLTEKEIHDSSVLFSNNYGIYSDSAPNGKAGKNIKLGVKYYEQLKQSEEFHVSFAYLGEVLLGQAYYLLKETPNGKASWVIQLVVHQNYRRYSIGKRLLYSVWGFSNDIAWGLATSNPITVKTLESATFRKVDPLEIKKRIDLIKLLGKNISFVDIDSIKVSDEKSTAFTNFYVSQKEIEILLKSYSGEWKLGKLEEGAEWLAFTFREQDVIELTKEKIDSIIQYSDGILKEVYSRMDMQNHPWAKHSESEVNFIVSKCSIENTDTSIADFGCGIGRHLKSFYALGFTNLLGIDFSKSNVQNCKNTMPLQKQIFIEEDCRYVKLSRTFDIVCCLYDVIGSFSEEEDNIKILRNIYQHLNANGILILSVMNMELTEHIATKKVDIYTEPKSLFNLKASKTMQETGAIFNPDLFLIDINTNLVYRKEMFINDNHISAEYVIRDKRYTAVELAGMLVKSGFEIFDLSYVQAGHWDIPLSNIDPKAKEILVFAKKV